MRNALSLITVALALAGCSNDTLNVDLDRFSRLPDLDSMNFAHLNVGPSWQYWEVRFSFGPGSNTNRTLGAGGPRQRSELPPSTVAALDTIPPGGFSQGCMPAACFHYIVAVDAAGAVHVINSRVALLAFLGGVDTLEEAALIIRSYNMYWSSTGADTGFRETGDGWQFVATQMVAFCTPVQTDRVLVLVRRNGSLQELDREVYQRDERSCV
jgi:hypothetical protein